MAALQQSRKSKLHPSFVVLHTCIPLGPSRRAVRRQVLEFVALLGLVASPSNGLAPGLRQQTFHICTPQNGTASRFAPTCQRPAP